MPQGVENLFKTASVHASSPRSQPPRADGRDVFQKILDGSRKKPAEPKEHPTAREAKPAERSKRSANTSRKRRDADRDEVELEDENQTVDPGSAEALPETESQTPVSEAEESVSSKTAEENSPADAAETIDPLTQATAAAQTAQPQQKPVEIKDEADADEANQAAGEGLFKGVATVVAGAAGEGDHASESPADADAAGDALSQGSAGAAQSAVAEQNSDELPDGQSSEGSDQPAAHKARKVAALGQTAPPDSSERVSENGKQNTKDSNSFNAAIAAANAVAQLGDAGLTGDASTGSELPASPTVGSTSAVPNAAQALQPDAAKIGAPAEMKAAAAPPVPVRPEAEFAETNHDKIVTSLKSQLMPNGGTMRMRLDPPEMGVLQITVKMRDGAMTASFETSNGDATKLLSHSLSQLKAALESQGISVEKLHVQESPKNQDSQANSEDGRQQQQPQQHEESARQEQQRKEMLRRMWRRLGIGSDPLDMVA